MVARHRTRAARLLGLVLALSMVAGMQAPAQANQRRPLRFMTRNLYLGASLTPIFAAATQEQLIGRATQAWNEVQASNFPARAERLVDEIATERPDLVGLQEATLYRISSFPFGPAENVALDFLAEIEDEIADRDLPYEVVAQVSAFDGELPVLVGPSFPNDLRSVRLTDRDVILARTDLPTSLLEVSNPSSGLYEAIHQIPILGGAGGTLSIARGWTSVEVESRDKSFTFLNTHLEAFNDQAQEAQSLELLEGPANTTDPVVMVGDFNSPADGSGSDSYGNIVGDGFSDAWTETMPGDPGYTCCHSDDLMSAAGDLDSRIDIIFFRGPRMHTADAEIVGEEEADKTTGGLWPSDHAGVVAKVMLDPRPNPN